jgi:hypothetical protein
VQDHCLPLLTMCARSNQKQPPGRRGRGDNISPPPLPEKRRFSMNMTSDKHETRLRDREK